MVALGDSKIALEAIAQSIYDADETEKSNLPSKNTDDNIEHELDYTKALLDVVSSNPSLAEIPKVKERLNMLKEVLADIEDHYMTSKMKMHGWVTRARMTRFRLQDTYCHER